MSEEMQSTAPASTATAVADGSPSTTTGVADSTPATQTTDDAIAHIESIQKELGLSEPKFSDFTRTVNEDGTESWVPDSVETEQDATGGSTAEESDTLPDDEIRSILAEVGIDPSLLDTPDGQPEVDPVVEAYEAKLKQEQLARTQVETELFQRQKQEALQRGDLFFGEPEEFKQVYSSGPGRKIDGFAQAVPATIEGIITEGLTNKFNELIDKDEFTPENLNKTLEDFKRTLSTDVQNMVKAIGLGASVEAMKGLHGELGKKSEAVSFNQRVQGMWHNEFNSVAQKLAQAGVPMSQEIADQATDLLNDLIRAGRAPEDAIAKASTFAKSLVSTSIKAGQQQATLSNTARAAATIAATGGQQVPVSNPQADLQKMMADPNVPLSEIEKFAKGA